MLVELSGNCLTFLKLVLTPDKPERINNEIERQESKGLEPRLAWSQHQKQFFIHQKDFLLIGVHSLLI